MLMRTVAQQSVILGYINHQVKNKEANEVNSPLVLENKEANEVVPFGSWRVDKYNRYYSVTYSKFKVIWGVWSAKEVVNSLHGTTNYRW